MDDKYRAMLEGVLKEKGVGLYTPYGENDAAFFIGVDYSTLKRWRRDGKVPHVKFPGGGISYLGVHIGYIVVFGKDAIERYERDHDSRTAE